MNEMTTRQAIATLRAHNEWRRGADTGMTDPAELGQAIDIVVEVLQKHLDDDLTDQWPVA